MSQAPELPQHRWQKVYRRAKIREGRHVMLALLTFWSLLMLSHTGPCQNYTVLNDSWRNVNTSTTFSFCDQALLMPGLWYRWMPPAGNVIPETIPPIYSCGTAAPMWLNGAHPTTVSRNPGERQLCANWDGNPCKWSTVVRVALCLGGYYVYMAPVAVAPECFLAWCGVNYVSGSSDKPQETSMSSILLATSEISPIEPVNNSVGSHCRNYTVLNESWRNVNVLTASSLCDYSLLRPGVWYRMMPPAGNAISETIPPVYSCGTAAPMWLNGTHPTSLSSIPVDRQLCANWDGNPCQWSTVVQVALCSGGYYVYMAPVTVTPGCFMAWCAGTSDISSGDIITETATTTEPVSTLINELPNSNVTSYSSGSPCQNYTVLDDSWRNMNASTVSSFCDLFVLKPGLWYRMMPPAGNAIPETIPPVYSCGTVAPMWINGTHPTSVSSGPVERQLCANWNEDPCLWSTVVQVALCSGGYYVYMAPVKVTPGCFLAWCAVNNSATIDNLIEKSKISIPESTVTVAFPKHLLNNYLNDQSAAEHDAILTKSLSSAIPLFWILVAVAVTLGVLAYKKRLNLTMVTACPISKKKSSAGFGARPLAPTASESAPESTYETIDDLAVGRHDHDYVNVMHRSYNSTHASCEAVYENIPTPTTS